MSYEYKTIREINEEDFYLTLNSYVADGWEVTHFAATENENWGPIYYALIRRTKEEAE